MESLAPFFDMDVALNAKKEQALWLTCRIGACSTRTQFSQGDRVVFSNAKRKLYDCLGSLKLKECEDRELKEAMEEEENAKGKASKKQRGAGAGGEHEEIVHNEAATGCKLTDVQLRTAWARCVTLGALPTSIVDNPGMKMLFNCIGIKMPARTTLARYIRDQGVELRALNLKTVTSWLKPVTVTFGEENIELKPQVQGLSDNWTAQGGYTMMGVAISRASVNKEVVASGGLAPVEMLRPEILLLDYDHFASTKDEDHDNRFYREAYGACLIRAGVNPDRLYCSVLDTTAVTRKMLKEDVSVYIGKDATGEDVFIDIDFMEQYYVPCGEHEGHLVAKHVCAHPSVKPVLDHVNAFSVWLRASDKRRAVLVELQRLAGETYIVLPLTKCPTRFFYTLLQMKQLLRLEKVLALLATRWRTHKVRWLEEFNLLYDHWLGDRSKQMQLLDLFEPMLELYNRMGCENEYTLSIRPHLFDMWNKNAIAAKNMPGCVIKDAIAVFQQELWGRYAALAMIAANKAAPAAKKFGPDVELSALEHAERLDLDSITNVAAYADPAMHGSGRFLELGGRRADARAELWAKLLAMAKAYLAQREATGKGAGAAGAHDGNAAAAGGAAAGGSAPAWERAKTLAQAKSALEKRPKSLFMAAEEFEKETERMFRKEVERRESMNIGEGEDNAEGTFQERLQAAFEKQCNEFEDFMAKTAAEDDGKPSRYGRPEAKSNVLRYSFWPSRKGQWNLLYLPAATVLCTQWTPMNIERVNSAAGIICSRLRASMTPKTLRDLVLGRSWLKDMLSDVKAPKDLLNLQQWAEGATVDPEECHKEEAADDTADA